MGPLRLTRADHSLDAVIENLQRESDAAVRAARAALGGAEGEGKLDLPRRFPDVAPDLLSVIADDADQGPAPAAGTTPERPL